MKKYTVFKMFISGVTELLVGYLVAVVLCKIVDLLSKIIFDYTVSADWMLLLMGMIMFITIIFYRKTKRAASQALKEMKIKRP